MYDYKLSRETFPSTRLIGGMLLRVQLFGWVHLVERLVEIYISLSVSSGMKTPLRGRHLESRHSDSEVFYLSPCYGIYLDLSLLILHIGVSLFSSTT